MKVRLPLSKDVMKKAKRVALEEVEKQQIEAMRRYHKLSLLAIYRAYGFGFKKLSQYDQEWEQLMRERITDEIFWYHVDKWLDQMGFKFEHEDYERVDR